MTDMKKLVIDGVEYEVIDASARSRLDDAEGDITDLQNNKANSSDVPTKVSDLDNDSGFITDAKVEDVTIDGTSVVASKSAAIPRASASNAGVVKIDPHTAADAQYLDIYAAKSSGNEVAQKVPLLDANSKILASQLPAATSSAQGAMSAEEKSKLSGIATGAEVNQDAFSNIKVGQTTIAADTATDTLELVAGDNVTLTPDATNDKVTIEATDTTYSSKAAASGGTDVSLVTTGEKYTWNNKLSSHQTIKQDGVTGATVNRLGTCSTAAGTAAKTVSITTGTFSLEAGARVSVKFTNANTADTPTLNVGSKGAKNIFHKGAKITTGGNKALLAGIVDFIYDGTQWHIVGNYIDTNTTYSGTSPISVSGSAISHDNSGVTAASKGDTSNQTPGFGSTFKVPSGTVNATGHLTAFADHTVKIPNATATTSAAGLMSATDKTAVNKIGTGTLNTTAQTIIPAINEHESEISSLNSKMEYIQNGESYTINNAYLFGMTNGSGTAFVTMPIFLPKKIPNGTTITVTGSWNAARKYDGTLLNISSTVTAGKVGDNAVYLGGTGTSLGYNISGNFVPSGVTLTFNVA